MNSKSKPGFLEVTHEQGLAADALDKSTVEQVIDPKELEAELLKQEQDRFKDPSEEEVCSMVLSLYTPRFIQLVDGMSNRQLRRIIKSLVEYPVGKEYQHPSAEEKEAFFFGNSILEAKMILMYKTFSENYDKIMEAVEVAKVNTTVEFGDKNNNEGSVVDNGENKA